MSDEKRNLNPSDPECAAALELVPAYALGVTDPDETRRVESKLLDCSDVAAALADYQQLTTALLYSAPLIQPPAGLEKAILAAASQPSAVVKPKPIAPHLQPAPTPWQRVVGLVTSPRFSPALAAAALVLLVLSNLTWLNQANTLRDEQARMATQLNEQQITLALLGKREANRVELVVQPNQESYVSVLWAPTKDDQSWQVLLYAQKLPLLTSDKAYQLWLIRGQETVSAGVFQVDTDGNAVWMFESNQPIGKFEILGITAEPSGGSPAPTSAPIALGNV